MHSHKVLLSHVTRAYTLIKSHLLFIMKGEMSCSVITLASCNLIIESTLKLITGNCKISYYCDNIKILLLNR